VIHLDLALPLEALGDVDVAGAKPGRIEHEQVVRVDRRAIPLAQGVACEIDGIRTAVFHAIRARDDLIEGFVFLPVAVDRMQARRSARRLVRLRERLKR
jgi:hypothetical protein